LAAERLLELRKHEEGLGLHDWVTREVERDCDCLLNDGHCVLLMLGTGQVEASDDLQTLVAQGQQTRGKLKGQARYKLTLALTLIIEPHSAVTVLT
jgi:hypothetical protein